MIRPRMRRRTALLICLLLAGSAPCTAAAEPSVGGDGVKMGFSTAMFYDVSMADVQAAVTIWARELGRNAGFSAQPIARVFDDLDEMLGEVRTGALDVVALTSLDYLRVQAEVPLEPALVGRQSGKVTDTYLLLVHRESGIDSLAELRGKSLAILGGGDSIVALWLDTLLGRQGLPRADEFLTVTRHGPRASDVLLRVFFRSKNACVATGNAYATAVELNPQLGRDLVVLAGSPRFPLGLMCLGGALGPERKQRIVAACLKVAATPAGRQLLTLFKVEDVVRFAPWLLDGLEGLLREQATLSGVAGREL